MCTASTWIIQPEPSRVKRIVADLTGQIVALEIRGARSQGRQNTTPP